MKPERDSEEEPGMVTLKSGWSGREPKNNFRTKVAEKYKTANRGRIQLFLES
jgi:hypothetical protein